MRSHDEDCTLLALYLLMPALLVALFVIAPVLLICGAVRGIYLICKELRRA